MARRKWTEWQKQLWAALIEHLNAEHQGRKHVRVRREYPGNGGFAVIYDLGPRSDLLIRISPSRSFWDALYDLAHEWAHVIVGWTGKDRQDHGVEWSLVHGEIRQAIFDFVDDFLE